MKDTHAVPVWPPLKTAFPIRYRKATQADAEHLAPRIREMDMVELAVTSNEPVLSRLQRSISVSDEAWAVLEDDSLIAVFGVFRSDIGDSPWILGTDRLDAHLARCLPDAKQWISKVKRDGVMLAVVLWNQNHVGQRWVERLGFRPVGPQPGHDGKPSVLNGFVMGTNHV